MTPVPPRPAASAQDTSDTAAPAPAVGGAGRTARFHFRRGPRQPPVMAQGYNPLSVL